MRRGALAVAAATVFGGVASASAQEVSLRPEVEPVSIGGVRVTLERLLQHAYREAPALAIARAQVELANEPLGAAQPFLPNPTLTGGAGPRHVWQNSTTDLDITIDLEIPIWIAGQRPARFAVARAARRTRERQLSQVRWDVHQRIHAGYRAALVARQRAEIARRIAAFERALVDITERRVAAGETSPLQLRLAQAEAAQAAQQAIAAVQHYRRACLSLAQIAGWDARRPPEPVGGLEAPRPVPSLDRLLELARAHSPVLEVRRAAIAEARARMTLAEREAWPTPSIIASYQREGAPGGPASGAGYPQDTFMPLLSIPIPAFELNQAGRAASAAELEVALAERDARLMILTAELEALRTDVVAGIERVAAYGTDILPRFEETIELFQRAFQLGEIDVLQISVAVERLLSTQLQALDAYEAYYTAIAALEAEVGTELWTGGER